MVGTGVKYRQLKGSVLGSTTFMPYIGYIIFYWVHTQGAPETTIKL